jgi:hypothetical protein
MVTVYQGICLKEKTLQISIFSIVFLMIISGVGPAYSAIDKYRIDETYTFATLEFYPKSHDFGETVQGEVKSTIFDIWRGGGCCSLTFSLSWEETWIDVSPASGVSHGNHVPITVTIDTAAMKPGFHTGEILIESNCGNGVFLVYVTIVGDSPDIEVKLRSGVGISIAVKNSGTEEKTEVYYRIEAIGTGLLKKINVTCYGSIPSIPAGQTKKITTPIAGFGVVDLPVQAEFTEVKAKAIVFFMMVLVGK